MAAESGSAGRGDDNSEQARPRLSIAPKAPSRYAQWAEDKYMRALEAPQMVAAFHGGGTLEIGSARAGQGEAPTSACSQFE